MTNWSRRNFIKTAGAAGGTLVAVPSLSLNSNMMKTQKTIKIEATNSNFEREPLIRPFGFKGGYMSEIWQTAAWMKSGSGTEKVGLCTQNVLWSDANVFGNFSESGGNSVMYAMTDYALNQLKGYSFTSPVKMLEDISEDVYSYGKKITDNPDLRKTFALNALVGIDNAAWMLFAAENGITSFDEMIPEEYRPALSHHHKTVASIPLMAYSIPISEIKQAADDGYFFMKIKIGQPGTQNEMLEKDKARLTEIHKAIGHYRTEHSEDGKLPYYFDANGRYEKKETLLKLIDHAKKIGAFEQIAIIEEPFPEHAEIDVSDIPIRLAADESAHTDEDALIRIQMGYKAIALKAIAKTLSMTMKIANVAKQNGVPCFCADLTVNPILIDWNKSVAARLDPFPGLGTGLLETNGHQNYKKWAEMETYHPFSEAEWRKTKNGVFELDEDYYSKSGGVLTDSDHYKKMFSKK
ncbi:MAG: twin-arginine translocation signal domain-containing protein [Prolixibacteraceae bacterium]|jgi:L-alanine-DL-glutamate epimerase-like enolase superfamily enzyme|nr:twin-arginine translocation signal domain-containing protein [Prolixibacteraceae bacterium]MBT6004968.1 twin-arginine translocation signal domain-containing protein [Prolixibacteraceae bacterium]MBT6764843.1 twin-arginine translocation signal domain-containing protein [Prolixibacteraceae bacterium]MBT6998125.1 twin-arginine translocation signal domain-containing protein [Prolixibacteraceae bacterium]MBT7393941.1 twin-arginine translocation signal domain-containing protein [Prolixibacteraceae